jgi:hypothetical protein
MSLWYLIYAAFSTSAMSVFGIALPLAASTRRTKFSMMMFAEKEL